MSLDSLRVMTYNAHHGAGNDDCVTAAPAPGEIAGPDCALDLARIANVIKAEEPDIVSVQELDRFWARSAGADQPEELAALLKMDYRFGANLIHPPDIHAHVEHEFGVATFTRFPIISSENYLLPNRDEMEQRGLLDTRLQVPGVGEIAVLNTHLQVGMGSNREAASLLRMEQIRVISNYVSRLDVPVILSGDFNTTPEAGEIDLLFGGKAGLREAWALAGEGVGDTIFAGAGGEPVARIDYIFASRDFNVLTAEVIDTETSRMASDHFPVVADLGFAD